MKNTLILFLLASIPFGAFAQTDSSTTRNESPYTTRFAVDGPIIGAGLGLTFLGFKGIQNKDPLTDAELNALSKNDVNGFDRFSAGWYSPAADDASYIPFYASFAYPVIGLLNKNTRNKTGQVMVLYLETMATTGALFTLAAGYVVRHRPLVYDTRPEADGGASAGKKKSKNSQRSFFAGHTAATAAASFFAAKVFADFNPNSKLKPYVWGAAALTSASVGYMRLKAGQHFLSDNLLGFGVGMAAGILVPHFHKTKNRVDGLTVQPYSGNGVNGMAMTYRLK
ncbi:MAG: phosphatase PAP2 family protein [Sphingobacteriaceae bacterium]|nr:phosphatase PAP2 family protein [Sphingobacteriaceae bacterium]